MNIEDASPALYRRIADLERSERKRLRRTNLMVLLCVAAVAWSMAETLSRLTSACPT